MAMGWQPKYSNTDRLLYTIRQIGEAIGELHAMGLSREVLAKLELQARALSTHASTSIEGNPLPLTDVKHLLKSNPIHIRKTEREVLNYNHALQKVSAEIKAKTFQLNMKTMNAIQALVVKGLMEQTQDIGRIRQHHVVIRDPHRPDAIIFIPPDYKDVPKLTKNLIDFIQRNFGKIDPIILAGLFHRQNVIIHPYMDGNGRTTRLLTTAILGQGSLDIFNIFAFENYYNQNIRRYFSAVGLQGDYYELENSIDFTEWLEYFVEGILDELSRVRKTIPTIHRPRLEDHHKRILRYIEKHGSITQREYGQLVNRSLAARKIDFQKLLTLGLLESHGGGRSLHYTLKNNEW